QGIEVAKKAGYPDLGLGVNYITTGERNVSDLSDNGKDAFFPQLTIKLPLYSKQYKAQREEARYRLEATRQQQTDLENDLTARFEEAYQDYRDARRKVQLNQEQINRAQQAIDILMANYSGGNEDFEEILSMQDKLLEFQLGLANAVAQQNKAVVRIEYLMGNEVETL
ncbi:MAG: TolC family protein, partial [Bacteroidetes bacterium SW_10_40_5]